MEVLSKKHIENGPPIKDTGGRYFNGLATVRTGEALFVFIWFGVGAFRLVALPLLPNRS